MSLPETEKMSHIGQVVEHEDALSLSSEDKVRSAYIPVGDKKDEPWATIEIDTWEGAQGFVIEWPTTLSIRSFIDIFAPDQDPPAEAVAVLYENGTRVEIESTYEYIQSELDDPDKWESIRLIDGANEFALFSTPEDEPNRFEFNSKDGNKELFHWMFQHVPLVAQVEEISTEEIMKEINRRIS